MKCYNYYFTPKDMDGLKICDVLYIYERERERERERETGKSKLRS